MRKELRIEDVAMKIGVSSKTVSRVLNNEPNVSRRMRARVLAGLRTLDYHPNQWARSLASRRSYLIALLYDNPSPNYVLDVQSGVLNACDAQGYSMMVRPVALGASGLLKWMESFLFRCRPDGLVLTPPICDYAPFVRMLEQHGVPYASISPKHRDRGIGAAMDDRAAVRKIVHHLVGLGHRRIAHISGPSSHGAAGWRLRGYRDGLKQAGLPFDPQLVVKGKFSFDSGVAGARRLLALRKRPTAVFAGNDDTAAGVLWAAAEDGLKVPDDMSVCGFDDTILARRVWPGLTTVAQPSESMGRIATEQLITAITSGSVACGGGVTMVPFTLNLRPSTGLAPRSTNRD